MSSNVLGRGEEGLTVPTGRISQRWITTLLLLAVLFPVIISFAILYHQRLSVPYQDDYSAILSFAIEYQHLPNLWAKALYIATAQHNEYRIGFEHAVLASEMELSHHLNFGFLVALGDSFLLGIGYLLWKMYSDETKDLPSRLLEFLPISFLFFALVYWENENWAMTGLQNTPVIFFSLFAIYLLVPARQSHVSLLRLFAACIMAAMAAFTSANGFLLGPVGLLFLLRRRTYTRPLIWCASFVVPLTAYLYRYHQQVPELHRFSYLTRPLLFFAFLGCAIPNRWLALLLGAMILSVVLLAARSRFDRSNPAASYFAIWLVATAALVAWVRGGVGFSIGSRYSFYSLLLLIFCYSFLTQHLPSHSSALVRRRFYAASLVFAFSLWFVADLQADRRLELRRRMVLTGLELYRAAPGVNSPMIDPEVERYFPKEKAFEQLVLTQAIQEGVYTLPPK